MVLDETPARRVVELTERKFARPTDQPHLRGPRPLRAGGRLAGQGRGDHDAWGDRRPAPVRLTWPPLSSVPTRSAGEVELVDRFGNLITNLGRDLVERFIRGGDIDITIGGQPVPRLVATYAEVGAGELCALFGSSDRLEIAVSGGSAAAQLGLGVGSPVQLVPAGPVIR